MVPAPATWLPWVVEHWNKWAIRFAAGSSLVLYIIVLLVADFRRYNRAWPFGAPCLWLAYQGLDLAGSYALGHLSLDDTGDDDAAAAREQLAVAFWAPFLLLHLGGPDNIGAYSLDDDKLGWRKAWAAISKAAGAFYVVYTKIYLADDVGLLLPASIVMVVFGFCRLMENVAAQIRALGTKTSDSSDKKKATDMLRNSAGRKRSDVLLSALVEWLEKMTDNAPEKAAEIYDKLYTKAGEVNSWRGYILRLLAPLATATTAILFYLYPKGGMQPADVTITYILMLAALFLDVVWLVAALASKSAKEFLEARPWIWFGNQILCSGWWDRLNRLARRIRPAELLGIGRSTYGSDFIGQYDLLLECTRAPPGCIARLWSKLESFFRQDDSGWSDCRSWKSSSKLQPDVKKELFKRIKARLSPSSRASNNAHAAAGKNDHAYNMKEIRKSWGQMAVQKREHIELDFFGSEIQEDILLWHIATTIYLCTNNIWGTNHAEAIQAVSKYLMFLLAARPHMLPDPPLRSLYEVTQQALQDLYNGKKANDDHLCCASKKEKLANIVLGLSEELNSGDDNRALILYAAKLARELQNLDASRSQHVVVNLVFDVWVDKLMYAGINCNRDSHARQLGKGGELVTIAWIAVEYVGVFPIGETGGNQHGPDPSPNDDDDKLPECPSIEQPTCHCHEGPHTCCMQEYCYCTQHYYYC